ncbi:COX15/CtaA family protein [Novacetimonas cocois]|uniref:Heme A synthase n=1 Tax=Novacetimonas cocois TaxID=1747507 RepID=A0A365YU20_9PROT|nr:COX15/CtaA family protein [Novacetimonas cocois]RBM06376.1 heme A synthase [Novacetimonas cocois]
MSAHPSGGLAKGRDSVFPANAHDRRRVSNWLLAICFMLIGMIALGGYTRLTGSGLSIMDWRPITGMIPPLSHAEWERQFALYKTIPQYKILHDGFGLAGFQQIFWAEWIHRFWGRLMGFVLLLPLIWFAVTGVLSRRLTARLVLFFVLGGLQGAIGWFMVASGFNPDSTAVAPVRLVLHLCCAFALYIAILWTALSARNPEPEFIPATPAVVRIHRLAWLVCCIVATTIIAGGFTAGTHAGFSYNTFPLMDGHLIPSGYARLHPFWLNWFQNIAAVQFDHRLLATCTAALIGVTIFLGLRTPQLGRPAQDALMLMGWMVLLQYALGVTTLLLVVPVWAGTVHQTCAALLLTTAIIVLHRLRGVGRV